MRNKLSKISIFSLAIILSLVIMFLPLAFMPELGAGKGDTLVSQTANGTPIQNSTTILSKDGSVENKTSYNSEVHFEIKDQDSFNKFFEQEGEDTKKIGLLTSDITELTLDLSKTRDLSELYTLDGNGYTITIKNVSGSIQSVYNEDYSDKQMYYGGGLVGLNKGAITNLKVVLDCDLSVVLPATDQAGATGILCSINQGTISNVSVTTNQGKTFSAKSNDADIFAGGVVGVNSNTIENVTVVNNGVITSSHGGSHNATVGGVVGVMYKNDLFPTASLAMATILGNGKIEATTGTQKNVGTIAGVNDICYMDWYESGEKNHYKAGEINGVLHGYTGTLTGRVNSKNVITGCGFASNVFMTDNTIGVNTHLGSCNTGDKIYGSIINPNTIEITGQIADVQVSFSYSSTFKKPIIDIVASITDTNDKAIIYDVSVDTYTNGETPQNSAIISVNDQNKIKENHKKVEFSVEGAVKNESGKVDKNKVININYGSLGSAEYTEDNNHAYTGQTKGTVTFKKYNNEGFSVPQENYTVLGYSNTGFEKLMYPGKYTKVRIQMNGEGNDTFAACDNEKRIIVLALEKGIDFEITKGELQVQFADKNGTPISNPSEAGFKNGYKITVSVKGTGLENAVDGFDIIFKDTGKYEHFEGKTVTIDTGEYGALGKNIVIVGTKTDGENHCKRVTNFSSVYNLKLDAVAPEYNITQDVDNSQWYTDFPTLKFSANDNTSGIKSVTVSQPSINEVIDNKDGTYDVIFKQIANANYTITITDNAGNTSTITKTSIKIDNVTPTLSVKATSNGSDYIAGTTANHIVNFTVNVNSGNVINPSGYTVYIIINGVESIIGTGDKNKTFKYNLSKTINKYGDNISFKVVANNGKEVSYDFGKVLIKINDKDAIKIYEDELLLNGKPLSADNALDKEYDGTTNLLDSHVLTVKGKDNIIVEAYYESEKVNPYGSTKIIVNLSDKNGENIYVFYSRGGGMEQPGFLYGRITPINITIDIDDENLSYGDSFSVFNYVLKDSKGNPVNDLGIDINVYVEGYKEESILNVGKYNLICDIPTLENYKFILEKGNLNIAKRQVVAEIDPEHSPYGVMYTGNKHEIKAYFTDYDGKRVDLTVTYIGDPGNSNEPINKGNYKVKFSLHSDFSKNYELIGDIEIPYEITAFKPVFEVEGLSNGVLKVPYIYGTDLNRFKINVKDNSNLLTDEMKVEYDKYLKIYYNGVENAYPTKIGEYNIEIKFNGADNNSNFANESLTFKYIIDKASFTDIVVDQNTTISFDGKEHAPNITGYPDEFVNSQTGYTIKTLSKEEFDALAIEEKDREDILYVVYSYNTKSENLNKGLGQYRIGTYDLVISFYNINYHELKVQSVRMTIQKPNDVKSFIGIKSESHVYNTEPMLINVPEFSAQGMEVKLVKIWLLDDMDQHKQDMSEFIDTGVTDVGTYRFIYEVTIKNINESKNYVVTLNDIELEITPATLNEEDIEFYMEGQKVDFDSDVPITKDYDGKPINVTAVFKGTADGATLFYESEKYVDARVQYVKVTVSKPNYNDYVKLMPKAYINKIVVTPEKQSEYKIIIGQDEKNKERITGTFKGVDGSDVEYVVDTSSIKDMNVAGTYECKIVSTNKNYVIDENVATVTLVISKDYVKIGITTAVCVTIFLLIAGAITYHYVRRYIKLQIKDNQLSEV